MGGLTDVNEDIISGVGPPVRLASLEAHGPRSERNLQREKKKRGRLKIFQSS